MNRWTQATQAERRLWVKLLLGLIRAGRAGDDESVVLTFHIIGRALGADAVVSSLHYLAERAASPWLPDDGLVYAVEIEGADGERLDIDDVPYPLRWSARMIAAAANGDYEIQQALVTAALDDERLDACVPVLTQMAASVPVMTAGGI